MTSQLVRPFAVFPLNEPARLRALDAYNIMDSPREQVFDDLTTLAASQFGVPVALVTLLGDTNQFFKAAFGTTLSNMERGLSFCSHCIIDDGVMVVPDAREDERFRNNPLVAGEQNVRFYAGAPLLTPDGIKLGTFCILDREPNPNFGPQLQQSLQRFASLASQLIEHRVLPQALRQARQMNEELERRTKEEIAASKAKTDFLSNVSHEIRTPMNGVLGMLQLLMSTKLDPEQFQYAEVARSSGTTLLALIDDLLDLSKIEAGKTTIDQLDFDLTRTLGDVVEMWRIQSQTKGLTFGVELSAEVPRMLIGDPGRLRQVLNNLISNALKFTTRGGITVTVDLVVETDVAVELRFAVTDTGIGMSPEQARTLFQPFVQADTSTTRQYGGTGLGLFISRRLVELMSGEIGIESVAGNGSTFWFSLTLRKHVTDCVRGPLSHTTFPYSFSGPQPSGLSAVPKPDREQHPRPALTAKNKRILVAEDNPTNQLVVRSQLTKLGYEVTIVDNGEDAVTAACQERFDLILMDCEMPRMDGYEATNRIRSLGGPHVPIIAVTAHAMAGNREACITAGMDYYLSKPLDMGRLARTLEKWCSDTSAHTAAVLQVNDLHGTREAESSVFDPDALLNRLMNDRQLAKTVISAFLDDAPKQVAALQSLVDTGDPVRIRQRAHALKGSAATVSAVRLSELAHELETELDASKALPLIMRVKEAFGQYTAVLQRSGWLL